MATATQKRLSKCLSGQLDDLGFDRRRIWERIHANNRCSRAKDLSTKRILETDTIKKILVGSAREGIGLHYLNDTDILQINHEIMCVKQKSIVENGKIIFSMVQNKAPAGYTYLKLASKGTNVETFEQIKYALVKTKRGKFLSSQIFMTQNDDVFKSGNGIISRNTHYRPPNGPSIPKYVNNDYLEAYICPEFNLPAKDMDFVRAFRCNADDILQAWCQRERRCAWPSKKTIAHVMTLPVYVVPVGQKGSNSKDLQWRISFTMAEIHIVQAFNNVQMKILVLMKLIGKHILQPVCRDITSYVMKTVMLWLAEKNPQKKFRKKHLMSRLKIALVYLRLAVERRYLPNYMIPKKNLFTNKLQGHHRKNVIRELDLLLQNGAKLISNFFNSIPQQHENKIDDILTTMYTANFIDKSQTCKVAFLSTKQLTDYFFYMFYASAWWQMTLYGIIFHLGPFLYNYGRRGFSDPLSFKLSHVLAESERKEQATLKAESVKAGSAVCRTDTEINIMNTAAILLIILISPHLRMLLPLLVRLLCGGVMSCEAMDEEAMYL